MSAVAVLALGCVAKNAYEPAQSDQKQALHAKHSRANKIGALEAATDMGIQKDITSLRKLDGKSLAHLELKELFNTATSVQNTVLELSDKLNASNRVVFESLVSENARAAFEDRNMLFTYDEADRLGEDHMKAYMITGETSSTLQGVFPLSGNKPT